MNNNDKIIGGVCKRIGDYFKINTAFVRLAWVILTLVTFIIPGLVVYIILWATDQPRLEKYN